MPLGASFPQYDWKVGNIAAVRLLGSLGEMATRHFLQIHSVLFISLKQHNPVSFTYDEAIRLRTNTLKNRRV
jgi:hypothetical protein